MQSMPFDVDPGHESWLGLNFYHVYNRSICYPRVFGEQPWSGPSCSGDVDIAPQLKKCCSYELKKLTVYNHPQVNDGIGSWIGPITFIPIEWSRSLHLSCTCCTSNLFHILPPSWKLSVQAATLLTSPTWRDGPVGQLLVRWVAFVACLHVYVHKFRFPGIAQWFHSYTFSSWTLKPGLLAIGFPVVCYHAGPAMGVTDPQFDSASST